MASLSDSASESCHGTCPWLFQMVSFLFFCQGLDCECHLCILGCCCCSLVEYWLARPIFFWWSSLFHLAISDQVSRSCMVDTSLTFLSQSPPDKSCSRQLAMETAQRVFSLRASRLKSYPYQVARGELEIWRPAWLQPARNEYRAAHLRPNE